MSEFSFFVWKSWLKLFLSVLVNISYLPDEEKILELEILRPQSLWCIDDLSMFVLSKWQFWTLFVAPDAMTRLGARTFLIILAEWSKKVWNE